MLIINTPTPQVKTSAFRKQTSNIAYTCLSIPLVSIYGFQDSVGCKCVQYASIYASVYIIYLCGFPSNVLDSLEAKHISIINNTICSKIIFKLDIAPIVVKYILFLEKICSLQATQPINYFVRFGRCQFCALHMKVIQEVRLLSHCLELLLYLQIPNS